ncbi:LysR family transcriptional regulator [Paenibacillus sinopodophylli]|uniref:LysR family transcriptional regulator n=1 Tax=Paenibacillus sinopodophylli TaxID=1837342 RepID=UPI00110C9AD0|nr:LysR family transcriptional regulator [Paenibacillus sinopodophylli]
MQANMEWYRIFIHTAKLGNLTKAAQELHITQPSVSYAIKQLETQLDVKLFDRLSKGVRLTPEGASVLEYAEKSFAVMQLGETKLQALKTLNAGELRIGASGPIIKHLLLPLLDSFHAQFPDVRIRLLQGKTADIRSRLKAGLIDIGLVHLPFADPSLSVQPLTDIQDCFVVGAAYRHLTAHTITPAQLAELPLLLLSEGSSTRVFIDHWFTMQGLTAEADMELSSMDMLVEVAMRGYGAAFVTQAFIQQFVDEEKLFILQLSEAVPFRSVGFAVQRDAAQSIAANRFIELLEH